MSESRDPASELEQLLSALVDGELSYLQQQHLTALLRDDPALQARYRDYLLLDALLRWEQPEAAAPAPPRAPRRWRRRIGWFAALAAAVLVAVVLWPRPAGVQPPLVAAEPTDNSVAVLLRAPGAVWGETEMSTRVGAPLRSGWLRLKSGFAHIEFYSGATVILEGPAELQLVSRSEAYCSRGKLRATVPQQAQGFTITTPTAD